MSPVLEVRHLSFAYGGVQVLDDITFCASEGERIGLVGANGAGKSTLLWCLLGLLKGRGVVRLLGSAPAAGANAGIEAVFQNPEDQLFMPRLIDDLALPLLNRGLTRADAAARASASLQALGLGFAADRPASHLSLGERKRAALAAALVTDPRVILLDEPTAELDGRSARHLADVLRALVVTLLVASHDLAFVRRVTSRVILLVDGRIAADGPSAELLDDTPLLERAGLI